jgi:hypothetical protein
MIAYYVDGYSAPPCFPDRLAAGKPVWVMKSGRPSFPCYAGL